MFLRFYMENEIVAYLDENSISTDISNLNIIQKHICFRFSEINIINAMDCSD